VKPKVKNYCLPYVSSYSQWIIIHRSMHLAKLCNVAPHSLFCRSWNSTLSVLLSSLLSLSISYLADEEGIANAQKSLGIGNDDGSRRMRWLWSNQVSLVEFRTPEDVLHALKEM
jgi:hypothetical protein